VWIHYTSSTITTGYRTRLSRFLSVLTFLNFMIILSDDSGINEKFLSLTTGEKYRNT